MLRPTSSGFGSTLGTGTPYSRRSITSDYDTSSILDSASMYGGDEPSTPSPPIRSQVQQQQQQQQPQQQQREVYVGDDLPPRSNSTRRKKSKEPSPSATLPTIVLPKSSNNTTPRLSENNRSCSITGDDIEAAFDAIADTKTSTSEPSNNRSKDSEVSSPDSLFGLSTIKEATDTDEFILGGGSTKHQTDAAIDEIDFDHCFTKYKQPQQVESQNHTKTFEEPKTKKSAPTTPSFEPPSPPTKIQESKSARHTKEQKRSAFTFDDIQTPAASISTTKYDTTPSPIAPNTLHLPKETSPPALDDSNDSNDEDVNELLGKLEVSIDLSLIYAHIHTHTYTHLYLYIKEIQFISCSPSSSSSSYFPLVIDIILFG